MSEEQTYTYIEGRPAENVIAEALYNTDGHNDVSQSLEEIAEEMPRLRHTLVSLGKIALLNSDSLWSLGWVIYFAVNAALLGFGVGLLVAR